MNSITKERIELFIKNPLENGLTRSEQMEVARIALASLEREQIRHEHAKWSDSTFGCVGPIGPLKHLSKEALEAAAEPDDLSEWADMQFLLWDAQRRAGISSATLASIACGLKKNIYGHHFGAPHDAADFRRCVALVEQIPEIRDSFDKVAKRVPAFKGILNEWDSLVALLKSEMKTYGNKAPETYRRISELRKD